MASFTKAIEFLNPILVIIAIFSVEFVAGNREMEALTALRSSLSDPDGVLSSWDPTLVDPCTWFHVTCDDVNNQVIRLDLRNANLGGKLAPELGMLENVQYLELDRNHIEGVIPDELGNLKNLISMDLFENNLDGSIPSTLGSLTSLSFMRLNDNKLTGSIPQAVVDIPSLRVLDLSTNDLSGLIPGPIDHIAYTNFSNNPRLGRALV